MIRERSSELIRVLAPFALTAGFTLLWGPCAGQSPTEPASPVYTNPRAPSSDPRVGLKAGLYDAGEAAWAWSGWHLCQNRLALHRGMSLERLLDQRFRRPRRPILPLRPPRPRRLGLAMYGSANSDLAFSGNHLFVGKLQRHQHVRHRQSQRGEAADFVALPRRPGRRVGVWASAFHVR